LQKLAGNPHLASRDGSESCSGRLSMMATGYCPERELTSALRLSWFQAVAVTRVSSEQTSLLRKERER
jgi:hypothetical protein